MPVATVPLSALRVPDGKIGVSLDLPGTHIASIIVAAADLDLLVREVDADIRATIGPRHAERTHVLVRRSIEVAMKEQDGQAMRGAMLSLLWLALHHPHHSDVIRRGMSEALRRTGRAHLTVTVDPLKRWSFALSENYVDMAHAMAKLPAEGDYSFAYHEEASDEPLH